MIDYLDIAFALLSGALLGVFFFAGLWWTVRHIGTSRQAALLILSSMLLRTGVVVVGFYFILGDNWQRLLMGLLGFTVVRLVATRFIGVADQCPTAREKSGYAP